MASRWCLSTGTFALGKSPWHDNLHGFRKQLESHLPLMASAWGRWHRDVELSNRLYTSVDITQCQRLAIPGIRQMCRSQSTASSNMLASASCHSHLLLTKSPKHTRHVHLFCASQGWTVQHVSRRGDCRTSKGNKRPFPRTFDTRILKQFNNSWLAALAMQCCQQAKCTTARTPQSAESRGCDYANSGGWKD